MKKILTALFLVFCCLVFAQDQAPLTVGTGKRSFIGRGWTSPLFPYAPCATNTVFQDGNRVTQSGANPDQYRTRHVLTKDVTQLRVMLGNWYSAGTGGNLCTYVGNTITVDFTVEKISSSGAATENQPRTRGRVGGGLTQQIVIPAFSTNVISDPINFQGKKGDIFYIRWSVSGGGAGTFYPNGGAVLGGTGNGMSRNNGEGQQTNVTSRVDDGGSNIGGNGTASVFGALTILGNPVGNSYTSSIAGVDDSIGVGTGDGLGNGTVAYRRGFIGRACDSMGIPFTRMGVGGTKLSDWADLTKVYQRDEAVSYSPVVVLELGTNDMTATNTAAMQTNALTIGTRIVIRGQKLIVCPITPKTTDVVDSWATVANQAYTTNEAQRRVCNNWLADTFPSSAVTDEPAQIDPAGSSTVFYTRYPITGSITAKVNGSTVTAPTITDAALGKLTFSGTPGGTVTISYTKQAGYIYQLGLLAPYGAVQIRFADTRTNVEVSSTGAAFLGWTSSGYVGGFWKPAGSAIFSSTASATSGSNTLIDTVAGASWTTDQYAGYVVRITSGLGAGQTMCISGHSGSSNTTITMTAGWVTQPASGDGYSVLPGYTFDGTHPTGAFGHVAMALALTGLSSWILAPLPASIAWMPSNLVELASMKRSRFDMLQTAIDDRRKLVLR